VILAAALTLQVALAPCTIDGVPGPLQCGTHKVWEDRDAKQGRQIDLSIIVLRAIEQARPDPFFMLQGGPGDAPSFNARFYSRAFQDIRRTRDIVLVDLRGTGKSAALTCPELAKPGADGTFDSDLLSAGAVRACRARLEKNTDLRLYTTEIVVDDLEEVRQALGYGPINIYGTSYGSRVAQVYMRRHPKSLRAVSMTCASRGLPASGCSTLGTSECMRLPRPAARMTTFMDLAPIAKCGNRGGKGRLPPLPWRLMFPKVRGRFDNAEMASWFSGGG